MLRILIGCSNKPADIFFIVDKSSSLGSVANFDKELSFIARFVEGFTIGQGSEDVRIGVISFSTDARLEFGLAAHGDKRSLQDALLNIEYSLGNTYTHKAFEILLDQGFSVSPRPSTVPRIGKYSTVLKHSRIEFITNSLLNFKWERTQGQWRFRGHPVTKSIIICCCLLIFIMIKKYQKYLIK